MVAGLRFVHAANERRPIAFEALTYAESIAEVAGRRIYCPALLCPRLGTRGESRAFRSMHSSNLTLVSTAPTLRATLDFPVCPNEYMNDGDKALREPL